MSRCNKCRVCKCKSTRSKEQQNRAIEGKELDYENKFQQFMKQIAKDMNSGTLRDHYTKGK